MDVLVILIVKIRQKERRRLRDTNQINIKTQLFLLNYDAVKRLAGNKGSCNDEANLEKKNAVYGGI